jgi:DNA (cytosine-5)-methyltransferase 1
MDSLSLFTGIGGFDLGFSRSGIETIAMCEADNSARNVLSYHWPETKIYEDVKDIDGKEYKSIDVIHGGFPCQDISIAGKREGLAGEKSGLWWEFYRIISEAMPKWIVIENVAGLLSSGGRKDLGAIIGALGELGYLGGYRVFDSRYFGVAQRRRRVFIVGSLGSDAGQKVLFESESLPEDFGKSGEEGKETSSGSDGGDGVGLLAESGVVGSLTKSFGGAGADASHAQNGWLVPERIGNLSTHFNAKNYSNLQEVLAGSVLPVSEDDEFAVRRLTPLECERLMGFPDNWTKFNTDGKQVSDSARYRLCGNAVVVNVAEWIGARISTLNNSN